MGFFDTMSGPGEWGMLVTYAGMAALWVVVVALVLWALVASGRRSPRDVLPPERPIDVLERRYAAGEIDEVDFRRMRLDLLSSAVARRPEASERPSLHLVTQTRSARELTDLDWGPRPVA